MKPKSDHRDTILIVGDWVVDEYWFLVRHYSRLASHTGFVHYRIASKPEDVVRNLCGAGHVARALVELRPHKGRDYRLVGLGNWHSDDTSLIQHLVHSREDQGCAASTAQFHLSPNFCAHAPDITLVPLDRSSPTIRVIRLYHLEKGGFEQINRVDWEPPPRPVEATDSDFSGLWEQLPRKNKVRSIVVYDLGKGAVTPSLITRLAQNFPFAKWYVRSKLPDPEWLKEIRHKLELLVIGPEVTALLNSWERLLVNDRITLQALNLIKDLPGKTVVLVSDQREIVVRESAGGRCFTGESNATPTAITQLGWASALFACMIRIKQDTGEALDTGHLSRILGWADDMAGVPEPGTRWAPLNLDPKANRPAIQETEWKIEVTEWEDALRGHGIIRKREDQFTLEVWRGSTYLPGYIACIRRKREIINRIGQSLISFKKEAFPSRSLSIMLQADPGAGKTLLAKCLAKGFGFYFLHYDITQMLHRDDLIELFDVVATKQAKDNEKILVFVDEINAMLDAGHAFGSFLSPLEENIYVRRGNSFSLKPCVWVFAGTQLDDEKLAPGEKFSDFKSRMTMVERLDYGSLADERYDDSYSLVQEARLEQVYLGATVVRGHFSDVQEVSREVLDQFYKLDPANAPARRIRQLAGSLRNVQYGRVTRDNCKSWDVNWGGGSGAQDMVTLVF